MLSAHFNECERVLLATAKIPANSGHPLHKGTPRESFVSQFLSQHLSERVSVGTGEVIDAESQPNEARNQFDIVVYKREYPKLHFGSEINAFLVESVVSTIEVKSTLTKDEFFTSVRAARRLKAMKRHQRGVTFSSGFMPPGPMCFIVAFDGPAQMKTVHGWIDEILRTDEISIPALPLTGQGRTSVLCPIIDGVFVLGRGFVAFDNLSHTFITDEQRQQNPAVKWSIADISDGALLFLFLQLTAAGSGTPTLTLNPGPYLKNFDITPTQLRLGE